MLTNSNVLKLKNGNILKLTNGNVLKRSSFDGRSVGPTESSKNCLESIRVGRI